METLFLLMFIGTICNTQSADPELVYVRLGAQAALPCPLNDYLQWMVLDLEEVLILFDRRSRNPKLNQTFTDRLSLSSENDLLINNVTRLDYRKYRCISDHDSFMHDVFLAEHVDPSNLTIHNKTDTGVIHGVVLQPLTLRCFVTSGNPPETMMWISDSNILKPGGPGDLELTLTPTEMDDGKNFTCQANNSEVAIATTVKIKLLFTPNLTVASIPQSDFVGRKTSFETNGTVKTTVEEGTTLSLICDDMLNNGATTAFSWYLYGKRLSTNSPALKLKNVTRRDHGCYTCIGRNMAGEGNKTIQLNVLYSASVTNVNVTISRENMGNILKCNVSGNPRNFTFGDWYQFSDLSKTIIRYYNSTRDGGLNLSWHVHDTENLYSYGGVYVCNVSNGIRTGDGTSWHTGQVKVTVKEKPQITEKSEFKQYGYKDRQSNLSVKVFSSFPVYSTWTNSRGTYLSRDKQCTPLLIETLIHGKNVYLEGYECKLLIIETKTEDFQDYTVEIRNAIGKTSFTVKLIYTDDATLPLHLVHTINRAYIYGFFHTVSHINPRPPYRPESFSSRVRYGSRIDVRHGPPEMPSITSLLAGHDLITVKWKEGFNGGYQQLFIIQYRVLGEEMWQERTLDGNSGTVEHLDADTTYEFRMLASNDLGNSSFTTVVPIRTGEYKNTSILVSTTGVITGSLFGLSGILMCFWWYKERGKCGKKRNYVVQIDLPVIQPIQQVNDGINGNNNDHVVVANIPPQLVNVLDGAVGGDDEGYSSIDRRGRVDVEGRVEYKAHRYTRVLSTAL